MKCIQGIKDTALFDLGLTINRSTFEEDN